MMSFIMMMIIIIIAMTIDCIHGMDRNINAVISHSESNSSTFTSTIAGTSSSTNVKGTHRSSRQSSANTNHHVTSNGVYQHTNINTNTKKDKSNLFYIYDYDLWPNISVASMMKRDYNEIMNSTWNNGAGPTINITTGSFRTDQYQLFSLIYHRTLRDHRRTYNPNEATTFIIPYDMASDAAYYKHCVRSVGRCFDFRKCPLAPSVEELLKKSVYFQRNEGRDHVLVVGMNYAMDHYIGKPKCKSLIAGTCKYCTKLAIDDYSYLHATDAGIQGKGHSWHAVPFPSDFHWTRKMQTPFPWENTNRPILVSYTGSTKSWYNPARRLRSSVVHYCEMYPKLCVYQSYGAKGSRDSFLVEGHDPNEIASKSVFCFQPIGDLMTRKGLFDSILQGCIPVTFDVLTAKVMYTWHWEESFWEEVLIQYNFHPVAFRYFDPVKDLQAMLVNRSEEVARKQRLIRERVFELQYSLESYLEDNDDINCAPWITNHQIPYLFNETVVEPEDVSCSISNSKHYNPQKVNPSNPKKKANWPIDTNGNPQVDAYEKIMLQIFDWHSGRVPDIRNGTVPECWNGYLNVTANKCIPGLDPDLPETKALLAKQEKERLEKEKTLNATSTNSTIKHY